MNPTANTTNDHVLPLIETKSLLTVKTSDKKNDTELFRTMKIYESTAVALEKKSAEINGPGPKRVQWKDIVDFAVSKVSASDLKKLREQKLTASDKLAEMFESYKVKNPKADYEMFLNEVIRNMNSKTIES